MDSNTEDALADTIGRQVEVDARRRFWLTHMRSGFTIFLLEALVVLLYLHLTPTGPHRPLLWAIVIAWAVCAAAGLALAPVVATRRWRTAYSVTWTVASTYAVGVVALLDNGINSPILLLLYLPIVYGALMFTPRAAMVCGACRRWWSSPGWRPPTSISPPPRDGPSCSSAPWRAPPCSRCLPQSTRSRIEQHEDRLLTQLAELAGTDELTGCVVRRVLRQRTERGDRAGAPDERAVEPPHDRRRPLQVDQ